MESSITNNKDKIFKKIINRIKNAWLKIWSSKLYTFLFLLCICIAILFFVITYASYYGGLLNMGSDDIIQYYPYVDGFFRKIKSGNLSLYDKQLLIGTSWFSGAYYVPLDIFTFIAFLLSYFIPSAVAYSITNLCHVLCGALLFYYVIVRHHSNKVAFIASIILLISGMTQTYYIFPVYLGILFYAPLAMLIVDLVIEKQGKWFYLIPIYVLVVVLFDFYMAYMLIAFMCFYLVIKLHIENYFSFYFKKDNFIFKNKKFWILFIKYMGFILLGVMISAFFLLPSAMYILEESDRSNSETIESMKYFSKNTWTKDIYFAHYFLQLINIYIPNEPHAFCLTPAGAYIREHATLYITSGGLIYLAYFFTIRNNQKINRFKIWVILFNILFCIPLFSRILGLNEWPYVRCFFIPLMFNLYASVLAMDNNEFKIGKKGIYKFLPIIILSIGMFLILFVIKNDETDLFIHYDKDSDYFKPILIPSLIFILIYIGLLITFYILDQIGKHPKIMNKLIPTLIFGEAIFSFLIIFSNLTRASSSYLNKSDEFETQFDNLKDIYDYNQNDGYRVNLYTSYGRDQTNLNIMYGANCGTFFQSFYNTNINVLTYEIYGNTDTDWSRRLNYWYNLTSGPLFNIKYVVTKDSIDLPLQYYNLKTISYTGEKNYKEYYYELKNDIPFIIYDKAFTDLSNLTQLEKQLALLNYAYVKIPTGKESYMPDGYEDIYNDNYEYLKKCSFDFYTKDEVKNYLNDYVSDKYEIKNPTRKENSSYLYYDITTYSEIIDDYDALYVWPKDSKDRSLTDGWMYLKRINENDNTELYQGHYNTIYINHKYDDYSELLVQGKDVANKTYDKMKAEIQSYNYEIYDNFLASQNKYRNKKYTFKGSTMHIEFDMDKVNKPIIIKTGYAYSDSWKVSKNYETICVDGSFLGIVIPENTENVNIDIKYETAGLKYGIIISSVGIVAYIGLITPTIVTIIKKRKKKEEII